jgi:hypothetical protein
MQAFRTKREAEEYFSALLARQTIGQLIEGSDYDDLMWLLQQHPAAGEKIGAGVGGFTTWVTSYGGRGFRIIRVDGTATDFSYLKCIRGSGSHKSLVEKALRAAVKQDIIDFRDAYFRTHDLAGHAPCEFSGKPITKADAHVDHEAPFYFSALVDSFLAARGLYPEDVEITPSRDNEEGRRLTDPVLQEAFREHHRRLAAPRIVHRDINLKIAGDARRAKRDRKLAEEFNE